MRTFLQTARQRTLMRSAKFGQRLSRNEDGVTAIEFAMVGIPFFMMLFGIMGVGLYFFSVFNLENAVEQASRPLRTGEWDKANPINSTDAAIADAQRAASKVAFSKAVCDQLAGFFDCAKKLRVQVVNVTAGNAPDVGQCLDKDAAGVTILVPTVTTKFADLAATQTVVVTACYQLDVLQHIPFIKLGNMPDGSTLIQASAAFKTEPY
jgi:Flp pilus assembly protein TadG